MAENEFDLTALLRAIGVKGAQGKLDLVELIQPTIQVGDLSAMSPAILPPSSSFGGFQAATAGEFTVFQIEPAHKGGSFVQWTINNNALEFTIWRTNAIPAVFDTGPTALDGQRTSHQPSTARVSRGASIVGDPGRNVHPNIQNRQSQLIYLPSDLFLIIESRAVAEAIYINADIQDVPVQLPPDAAAATLP